MFFGEYDYDTDIRVQRKEAFDDGVIMGENKAKSSIALAFLNSGVDLATVSKCTNMSTEDLQGLMNAK